MSRHRDIRNMDYSDDYDGYDDIYGHSVDDDYCISPSNRQYLYNREHSTRSSEGDIKEEEEEEYSDIIKAKLELCLKHVREVLGPVNLSKEEVVNVAVSQGYDPDMTIASLLENPVLKQIEREKDVTRQPLIHLKMTQVFETPNLLNKNSKENLNKKPSFSIPNIFNKNPPNNKNFNVPDVFASQKPSVSDLHTSKKNFNVPNIFNNKKSNFVASDLKGKNGFNIPNVFSAQNSNLKDTKNFDIPNIFSTQNTNLDTLSSKDKKNFSVPNIFSTQSSNLSTLDSKEKKNFSIPNIFDVRNSDIDGLNVNKLSISELDKTQDSFTSLSEIVDNHLSELKNDAISESFENLKIVDRKVTSDHKDRCLLQVPLNLRKRRTNFAKVIGRKYRHPNEKSIRVCSVFQKYIIRDIDIFQFTTPSPDDVIKSHLKR